MKVWWCEEHRSTRQECLAHGTWAECRIREMRLVSVDALVIEKVEGEWPKWAVNAIGLVDNIHASYVLDNFALASAQVGGK